MKIYNLTCDFPKFEVGSYQFERVPNYDSRMQKIYRPKSFKATLSFSDREFKRKNFQERYGSHQHLYDCNFVGTDQEPHSVLYTDTTQLEDVLLLWRFFSGRSICSEIQRKRIIHVRHGLVLHSSTWIPQLLNSLSSLNSENVEPTGVATALFFYLEASSSTRIESRYSNVAIALEMLAKKNWKRQKNDHIEPGVLEGVLNDLKIKIETCINEIPDIKDDLRNRLRNRWNSEPYHITDKIRLLFESFGCGETSAIDHAVKYWQNGRNLLFHSGRIFDQKRIKKDKVYFIIALEAYLAKVICSLLGATDVGYLSKFVANANSFFKTHRAGDFRDPTDIIQKVLTGKMKKIPSEGIQF